MRIAAAGYLEMPNGTNEALSPFVSHLWAIYLDRAGLSTTPPRGPVAQGAP